MKTKKGNLTIVAIVVGMLLSAVMASSLVYFKSELTLSSTSANRLEEFYKFKSGVTRLKSKIKQDVFYLNNNRSGDMGINNFSYTVNSCYIDDTIDYTKITYNVSCKTNTYILVANMDKLTGITNVNLR